MSTRSLMMLVILALALTVSVNAPNAVHAENPRVIPNALDDGQADDPIEDPRGEETPNPNGLANGLGPTGGGGLMAFRQRASAEGERVVHGLQWLAWHQSSDGSWSADGFAEVGKEHGRTGEYGNADGSADTGWAESSLGVTGLALLAFLGAGYTHQDNEYANTVKLALRYLKNVQDNDGCFGDKDNHHFVYAHAICTIAMCEAYAMTGSAILKGPAQKGIDFVCLAQNDDPDRGLLGWRYGVKPGDSDTSVTGWMLHALHAGKLAELDVPDEAIEGGLQLMGEMLGMSMGYPKVGYITPGGPNARLRDAADFAQNPTMNAIYVAAQLVHGVEDRTSTTLRQLTDAIVEDLPTTEDANKIDFYYWYFGSLATFQMGGDHWKTWWPAVVDVIEGLQRLDAEDADGDEDDGDGDGEGDGEGEGDEEAAPSATHGSWDANGAWGTAGGRVYATAIALLTLETGYRYEMMGGDDGDGEDGEDGEDGDDGR